MKIGPSRVSTIEEWPIPKSFYDVKVFLGFAKFYQHFIQEFSKIVEGPTEMLKASSKGKFQGINIIITKDAEISF